jgi:hypothetical protein
VVERDRCQLDQAVGLAVGLDDADGDDGVAGACVEHVDADGRAAGQLLDRDPLDRPLRAPVPARQTCPVACSATSWDRRVGLSRQPLNRGGVVRERDLLENG